MSTDTSVVTYERRDGIAYVTLNRPQALNSISTDMRERLPRVMDEVRTDPQVRVVLLRGAGERGFCAGADVKEFAKTESITAYRNARVYDHWMAGFDRCRKPIVAAIHGACLGGGLDIALACDIRIASEDAYFALPETGHGVVGGTQRALRMVGMAHALHMALTGRRFTAVEALAMGLVTEVVPRAELPARAQAMAELIASKAPLASMYAKEAIRSGADLSFAAGNALELDLMSLAASTEDRIEAGRAFMEKRKPVFKGR